jgi:hypothetical protein
VLQLADDTFAVQRRPQNDDVRIGTARVQDVLGQPSPRPGSQQRARALFGALRVVDDDEVWLLPPFQQGLG